MPQYIYPPIPYGYPQPYPQNNFQLQQPQQFRQKYYCWTHDKCNHHGNLHHGKMMGHQDDATFQDKKGGSTCGCT
eukprot:15354961-Ditylum_brightwellii.AAC.1